MAEVWLSAFVYSCVWWSDYYGMAFEDVCYSIDTGNESRRTILDGVSGIIKPGELVAIMGPSGNQQS